MRHETQSKIPQSENWCFCLPCNREGCMTSRFVVLKIISRVLKDRYLVNVCTAAQGYNIMFNVSTWCAWERVYKKCAKGKKLDCPKWVAKFHLCSINKEKIKFGYKRSYYLHDL